MTDQTSNPTQDSGAPATFVYERIINAPRERVWQAWTDPRQLEKWWGPRGWTTTIYTMDVRPGGKWHYCMRQDEDGMESWGLSTYKEVTAPSRLTYDDAFSDKDGNVNPQMPVMPIEVQFIEQDGKTRLYSITHLDSAETLAQLKEMGMEQGLSETWDRLEELVTEAE
jgi:uncharacterized protein YndB with AHSA1/START domain